MRCTAAWSSALAPSPYTVSVGKATSPPLRTMAAARAIRSGSGWVESTVTINTVRPAGFVLMYTGLDAAPALLVSPGGPGRRRCSSRNFAHRSGYSHTHVRSFPQTSFAHCTHAARGILRAHLRGLGDRGRAASRARLRHRHHGARARHDRHGGEYGHGRRADLPRAATARAGQPLPAHR